MNIASAQVQIADFQCLWSLTESGSEGTEGERTLKLAYQIEARSELYVADRLWRFDASRSVIPDPLGVYRYVRDDSLRLVFDTSPMPPNTSVRVTYAPLYSRVLPGKVHARELTLTVPVEEYSSAPYDSTAPTVIERVARVVLVMAYRLRATMDRDPAPPIGESEGVGFVVANPSRFISSVAVSPLAVRCRTVPFARYALPGDAPPPSAL